jgi:hypothetical protein
MTALQKTVLLRQVLWLGACFAALLGSNAIASEGLTITAFPDYEIEVRKGGQYSYMPGRDVATPPVRVLEVDELNYLKIKAKDGGTVWVNKAEVQTSDLGARRKNCQDNALALPEDSVVLGVRRLGDKCER